MTKDYPYHDFQDPETGIWYREHEDTGEIVELRDIRIEAGSTVHSPRQMEAYRKKKEEERKRVLKQAANNPLGRFYFVPTYEQFIGVSPISVTRLIYLNTFISYEGNRLMLTERTPMQRKDLARVLGVSNATVSRFMNEVCPAYITEDTEGLLFTNGGVFKRGALPRKQYCQYQKFYIDGVRRLYAGIDKAYHKQLGYIFKLLPFVNIEYNLVCNPASIMETDLEQIQLISVAEFCEWIGFDVAHLNKLVAAYSAIRFEVEGKRERFCALSYDGVNKANARIFVNPRVMYNGSDYNKVAVLGAFCRAY